MKLDSIGELIASRTLTIEADGNAISEEVTVLLGKPQQWPDHDDYFCPYQIKGAGDEKLRYMGGVDSFQALHLALSTLRVELEVLNKHLAGRLRWKCDDSGALGFPGFADDK
jgi:hypothetical protein